MTHPLTLNNGFTPGTPVFAHYTSARRWYAPHDLAKVNNSEIERVTQMDNKKKKSQINMFVYTITSNFPFLNYFLPNTDKWLFYTKHRC